MDLQKIKQRIQDAMMLIGASDVESMSVGIAELESVRPELQEYVNKYPKDAEGHLEISKTYQIPIFIAMKLDSFSQNDRMKAVSILMQYMSKSTEYAKQGKSHLEEFIKLGFPDPKMIDAARSIIKMLDNIINQKR